MVSNVHKLSNKQLYAIIQNKKLDQAIREPVTQEFDRRNLPEEELAELIATYNAQFKQNKTEGLSNNYKILLIVCPFFIEIYNMIAGRMLANGQKKKWYDYKLYVCIGFLLWAIVIISIVKYGLFNRK